VEEKEGNHDQAGHHRARDRRVVTPATAALSQGAKQAHPQQAKAVRACLHGPVFAPGRNATLCGPQVFRNGITVWYRDPASGTIVPIPGGKWRTEDGR